MISEAKDQVWSRLRKTKDELVNQRKDLAEEFYERYNKQAQKIEKTLKDIKSIREATQNFNQEAHTIRADVKDIIYKEADTISSKVRDEINKAIDELHASRIKLEHEISQRVRKGDLVEFKNEISTLLDPKVELSEVQKALDALQTEIANRLVNTKVELQNNLSSAQEYFNHQLAKKCNADEVNEMLSCKVDSHHNQQLLELKANKSDIDAMKGTIDRIIREVDCKVNSKDLQHHVDFTRSSIEDMTKELLQKAHLRDLNHLQEEKANKSYIEEIFQTLDRELKEKVSSAEIKASLDEQALINEALCSENCLGRWVWKSGELKASCLVPWEVQ